MVNVEYIENGKRVIIPAEVREALKDLAEHAEIKSSFRSAKKRLPFTPWMTSLLKRA